MTDKTSNSPDANDSGNEMATPKPRRKTAVERPFPRRSLEDCIKIALAIKTNNGGNPWASEEVADAVGASRKSSAWYYYCAASRDYSLTDGTHDTDTIAPKDLGRRIVYAASAEAEAKRGAFLSIDLFKRVLEHCRVTSATSGNRALPLATPKSLKPSGRTGALLHATHDHPAG